MSALNVVFDVVDLNGAHEGAERKNDGTVAMGGLVVECALCVHENDVDFPAIGQSGAQRRIAHPNAFGMRRRAVRPLEAVQITLSQVVQEFV